MHHGTRGVDVGDALEAPFAAVGIPVERPLDALARAPCPAVARPQVGAPVAAVGHELGEVAVRDGQPVDLERRDVHLVAGPLVVVGEPAAGVAHLERTGLDPHGPARGLRGRPRERAPRRRVHPGRRELEALEDRLRVLLLVLHEQLPQEAAGVEVAEAGRQVHPVEHLQRPLAHGLHVLEPLGAAKVGEAAAAGARGLGRVVDLHQVRPQRRHPRAAARDPEVLERRDVTEVPHQRAHERVVDALEILVAHRLDQPQRPLACLGQQDANPAAEQRLSPSKGHCYWIESRHPRIRALPRVLPVAGNVTGSGWRTQ